METTSRHISDLLYEHDCVIVPGFGAFVTSRVPASIDKKRGLMLPPRKDIVFNRNLTYNDGLLVGYIASSRNISMDEAISLVADFVEGLQKSLRNTGRASIEGIGIFRVIGREIAFIADGANNYLLDSYGLSAQYIDINAHNRTLALPSSKQIRRVAASIALLVGLMLVAPETKDVAFTSQYSQASFVQFDNSVSSNIVPDEVVEPTIDAESESEAQVAEENIESAEVFHIIVGSFPSERDANKFIASMNKQGVDGLQKLPFGRRFRVSAAVFADHDEAVRNNRLMRKIKGFENAWVLRDKK